MVAVNNTPASLIEARREAETRKLVAREKIEQTKHNVGGESSSSDSDGDSTCSSSREQKRKHKREKRKKEKRERKLKKAKKKKKKEKEKEKRKRARSSSPPPNVMGATFAEAEAIGAEQQQQQQQQRKQQRIVGAVVDGSEPQEARRKLGAQRAEDAAVEAERAQRVHVFYDASLGVHRSVRESGEVVEQCVSRSEQQRLMHAKARHVGPSRPPSDTYTGRDKFPSQHPWYGYK